MKFIQNETDNRLRYFTVLEQSNMKNKMHRWTVSNVPEYWNLKISDCRLYRGG